MARKPTHLATPGPPQVDPSTGITLLQLQTSKGHGLLNKRPINENEYESWNLVTKNVLEKTFGANSPNISSIMDIGRMYIFPEWSDAQWEQNRFESLERKLLNMEGLVELLQTEAQLQGNQLVTQVHKKGHKIFIVHGHDNAALHETARFLEGIDQDIIILREQPNEGRTIIEKFENYSDVGFAVVLLTPDDQGGTINDKYENQKNRARQNVILELGYFLGRLGRNRVCALYRKGVEIPSDYSGVLYLELDENGGWRLSLAKELKAAGLPVDMNKAV